MNTEDTAGLASPPRRTRTRTALGLFPPTDTPQRNTSFNMDPPTAEPPAPRLKRTSSSSIRRQTMEETLRSISRQYGRRRRLNSTDASAPTSAASSVTGKSRGPSTKRRGDSRALFSPTAQPSVQDALVAEPTFNVPRSAGGSAMLAHQMILSARKMAQEPEKVRPRASMPVINGARRVPQRTRSHVARGKKHDELSDALTMKSVEIRGGRIVLDDPSSSESDGEPPETAFRRRVESVGSTASDYIAALGEEEWEEGMRRRWYARRCLGLRQPFDSLHRLAKAEHSSANPFPLLSDLRRVLGETRCELGGRPVDVLLCSESIVVCAASSPDSDEKPQELRAIDFSDELVVRVDDTDETLVHVSDDEQAMVLKFASGGRVWVEQAVQARTRLDILLQDLRLDEEDYVERPPVPLLARGRSSIAGSVANADSVTALGSRFRKRQAQGGVLWVPDHETSVCMVCRKTAFSMMVRRHHCRACGLVICYRCSTVEDKRRLCVRCSGCQTALIPKPSLSLQTLGRRAAEYLPAGDVVMQMAAQRAAAVIDGSCVTRVKPDRHARRPLSTVLFTSADDDNAASNLDCYK